MRKILPRDKATQYTQPHPPPVDLQLSGCTQWLSALLRWRGWQLKLGDRTGETMRKRSAAILGVVLVALVVTAFFCTSRTDGGGKVMAHAEKYGASDSWHTVTVKRFETRYRTELLYRGKFVISSFECYEGSVPPATADISWPTLGEFTVNFDTGMSVRCVWDSSGHNKACWERK